MLASFSFSYTLYRLYATFPYAFISPTVPAVPTSCNISLSYNQSSSRLQFIAITWDTVPVSHMKSLNCTIILRYVVCSSFTHWESRAIAAGLVTLVSTGPLFSHSWLAYCHRIVAWLGRLPHAVHMHITCTLAGETCHMLKLVRWLEGVTSKSS